MKNKQIVIKMHYLVLRLPLESGYLPRRSNMMQNNFLHENTTFIETFAMEFMKILEFWDLTAMTTYFITDPDTLIILWNHAYKMNNKNKKVTTQTTFLGGPSPLLSTFTDPKSIPGLLKIFERRIKWVRK